MPRSGGFRVPSVVSVVQDFRTAWGRLRSDKDTNAHISRIPFDEGEILLSRITTAEARHKTPSAPDRPLEGYLFCIKDNIQTVRLPTTCASKILQGFRSPADATVVKLLRRAGAHILTKTNMDEFGMGSHSTHSAFGAVKNGQRKFALSVGGSSGGSAMAVANEQCHIALGTDTGGSVRLPAAYLGLVGFKPSYGLLSRYGVVPYANSLDTVGIIARNCLDVFLTFSAINFEDKRDPTCLSAASRERIHLARNARRRASAEGVPILLVSTTVRRPWLHDEERFPSSRRPRFDSVSNPRKRRIGFPVEYNINELHPLVRSAWMRTLSLLESHGHEVVPISLPSTKAALSAYYVLAPAEASSNLAKYDGVRYGPPSATEADDVGGLLYADYRGANFGAEVKRRILLGAYSLSADAIDNYFIQAQKVRRLVQRDFDLVFKMKNPLHNDTGPAQTGVDFIVCPTAPTPPPRLETIKEQTPLEAYVNDVFTVPASLAGLPAISVPAPLEPGIGSAPERMIGIQIIGQYGDDYAVIQFAKTELESRGEWDSMNRVKQTPTLH